MRSQVDSIAFPPSRDLDWEGCCNARDLGGLATRDGRWTRRGAVVRSDSPYGMTAAGWGALRSYGLRTLVDLRSADEVAEPLPSGDLTRIAVPLIDIADEQFARRWRGVYDPPRYCRETLARWPDRHARAVMAVALAKPGGVLLHCRFGRDRSGVVAALLLTLAGVPLDVVARDYAASTERLRPAYERRVAAAADERERRRLIRENVAAESTIVKALDGLDVREYLLTGGASAADLDRAVRRLVGEDLATPAGICDGRPHCG